MMSLYEEILELGEPYSHHESDLYIPVNPVTTLLLEKHQYLDSATTFISQVEKVPWYDVPFMYDPFWDKGQDKSRLPDYKKKLREWQQLAYNQINYNSELSIENGKLSERIEELENTLRHLNILFDDTKKSLMRTLGE